jgi:hypothetical protein
MMKKNIIVLLSLVAISTCLLLASCSKTVKVNPSPPDVPLDANGKPPIESQIDPSLVKPPTPATGAEADKDPASTVVRSYYYAIQTKDYEKAYSLITGEFKKKKGTFTDFVKPLAQAEELGRTYGNVTILGVTSSQAGTEKIVTFTLVIFEKQKPITLTGEYFLFQQKDGSWLIADTLSQS